NGITTSQVGVRANTSKDRTDSRSVHTLLPSAGRNTVSEFVRPMRREDIRAVAETWLQVFRGRNASAPRALEDYFEALLFENPWRTEGVEPLLFERNGTLLGFLGVVPRPITFEGRRLLAAVATQLMVAPGARYPTAAFQLLTALFEGPQDLTYSDGA